MSTLTVFFDDQYWVGVIEAEDGAVRRVHRFVFGPEPSGPQILKFVLLKLGAILARSGASISLDRGQQAGMAGQRPSPARA